MTVLIGANNYGFADIVQQCVTNWLTSPSWWKNYCYDDSSIKSRFTSSAVNARTNEVAGALANVAAAMANAGYSPSQWTLVVQTYWSPVPNGNQFRYSESGWTRQATGGCGMWNKDANWANATAVTSMNYSLTEGLRRSGITNAVTLDMSASLNGHRICESGVGLLEEKGLTSWTQPGAADKSEWVNQIRTTSTIFGPYQLQEGLHANYWGQLAMRNCLRLGVRRRLRARRSMHPDRRRERQRRTQHGADLTRHVRVGSSRRRPRKTSANAVAGQRRTLRSACSRRRRLLRRA